MRRTITMATLLSLIATSVLATVANARFMLHVQEFMPEMPLATNGDIKVPVTLGVMSRCPDALLCESVFDKVLAQVGDKIQMSLSFIGKYVFSTYHHIPKEFNNNPQTEFFRARLWSHMYAWTI